MADQQIVHDSFLAVLAMIIGGDISLLRNLLKLFQRFSYQAKMFLPRRVVRQKSIVFIQKILPPLVLIYEEVVIGLLFCLLVFDILRLERFYREMKLQAKLSQKHLWGLSRALKEAVMGLIREDYVSDIGTKRLPLICHLPMRLTCSSLQKIIVPRADVSEVRQIRSIIQQQISPISDLPQRRKVLQQQDPVVIHGMEVHLSQK